MLKRVLISSLKLVILVILCLPNTVNHEAARDAIGADLGHEAPVHCDIQRGPCTKYLAGGMIVTLDILPKPVKAMTDLKFQVTLSGGKITAFPFIDLGMPGMEMGPNRVELRTVRDNVYEGQGLIVRCPSGRRTWKATVTLPEVGKVGFVFDVIY